MKLNTLGKGGLILSILLTTMANAKTDKIPCPSIEKIQQASQQINNPFLYDGTYRITTSAPVFQESNLSWVVGVNDIVAGSSDEAIDIARTTASNANHKKHEYAEVLAGPCFNLYMCHYGPGDVSAVGIDRDISKQNVECMK